VLSLIPTLQKNLLTFYDPEKIKLQLQQKSIITLEKYSLWNKLKIITFTRAFTALYAITLLIVTYRIQLNIIGRYISQPSVNNTDDTNLSSETQLEYLLFIQQHLLQNGLNQLAVIVEEAVSEIIAAFDLRTELTYEDIKTIFNKIRNNIEKKNHQIKIERVNC